MHSGLTEPPSKDPYSKHYRKRKLQLCSIAEVNVELKIQENVRFTKQTDTNNNTNVALRKRT